MQLPQLSNPNELDMETVARKFEQRISALTTQNIMLETQLEAMTADRQKLIEYIESQNQAQAETLPAKKAS